MGTDDPPRRFGTEAIWVIAMTLLGAGLRLKGLGTLGLDHFDEGIYAQAATWIFSEGGLSAIDPGLIPYAPPGYPVLVGLAYSVLGLSGSSAILVSILAGVLTIPGLSWIARRCFGRGAGAATASLVALAGPHVVFSRTGLTDSTFLFAWTLAMIAGVRFLERPGARRAVWLGVFVGLAQLVKYNGGMVGVIVALTVGLGAIRPGEGRRSAPRAIGFGVLAAGVSALVYLPWFVFVERTTGYAGLMEHHGSYVDGLPGWFPNWRQQMAQAQAMVGLIRGGLSWLGVSVALAWLGASIGQGGTSRRGGRSKSLWPIVFILLAILSLASPANLSWWAALAWSPILLMGAWPARARLVATWFLVMALSTPMYHPYARLWLPTLAASWVISGGLLARSLGLIRDRMLGPSEPSDRLGFRGIDPTVAALVVSIVLAILAPVVLLDRVRWFPNPMSRSDGLRTLSERFRGGRNRFGNPISAIHLYARPPLRFYLMLEGSTPVRVHDDFDSMLRVPREPGLVLILDGAMGRLPDDSELESWNAGIPSQVEEIPASVASVLDARPESVFRPSSRRLGVEPQPDGMNESTRVDRSGSCRVQIVESP